MTLEHKKLDLIQMIARLKDEALVSKVIDFIVKVNPEQVADVPEQTERAKLLATISGAKAYAQLYEKSFNLEALKKEQKVKGFTSERLSEISREADVQEPIEVLLNSID